MADGGWWQLSPAGVELCRQARVECLKLNATGRDSITPGLINLVWAIRPSIRLMVRLMGVIGDPVQYVDERLPSLRVAYEAGCRLFELGNEPNHPVEGWGRTHHSAAAYGVKWAAAERRLRSGFPDAAVLFPCPSPDSSFQGAQSFHPFLQESSAAARAAGGRWEAWGLHVYWGHAGGQGQAVEAVRQFCADYPGPDVYVTEFSRQPGTDKANKGQEYKAFVSAQFPVAVKGLFGFVLEASRGWESETWDAAIAQAVGSR
ncbi:MAG TPA: glycosyl hydrolase [Bellilinea sp.]|nr:glycosyl hydrolase [Bellilinea sp.]